MVVIIAIVYLNCFSINLNILHKTCILWYNRNCDKLKIKMRMNKTFLLYESDFVDSDERSPLLQEQDEFLEERQVIYLFLIIF